MKSFPKVTWVTTIVLTTITVIAIVFISIRQSRELEDTGKWIAHTNEVQYQTTKVLTAVVNNATKTRDFLLTGDKNLLTSIDTTASRVYAEVNQLRTLTADNTTQQARIDSMLPYIDKRLAFSRQVIALAQEKGQQPASELLNKGDGRIYSEHIRSIITQMQSEENNLMLERKESNRKAASLLSNILFFLVIIVVILMVIVIQRIRVDFITRKKAEQELRYRATLMSNISDAVFSTDMNLVVRSWNKGAEEMYGWKEAEAIGKEAEDLFKIVVPNEGLRDAMRAEYYASTQWKAELISHKKSGEPMDVLISSSQFKDEDGNVVGNVTIHRDISENKRLEREILKANTNLERKVQLRTAELERKNKELEQFAYVASHDLQEPLKTISSFVELLGNEYHGRLDENADKYITYIAQSSQRMRTLIKDLLDYSRIGKEKTLVQVDCNAILQEVLADMDLTIKESSAEIIAGPLPVLHAYATELKQLFQNLTSNAIKFRKKNTVPEVKITAQKLDHYWQFSFRDNGIGIEDEHNDRVFVIFQRLHNRSVYEGSGIGLAHCKKIVELHGGKIWVESQPGQGSTFYFTIPEN